MKTFLLLIGVLFITWGPVFSQCTFTTAFSSSSASNNASIGSIAWANPSDGIVLGGANASAGSLLGILASANTNYLVATGFGFSIPVGATICGISVSVRRSAAGLLIGSSVVDNSVRIIKSGAISGSNEASGSGWAGSLETVSYGGGAHAWGTTWTPADVNDANFGVAISAKLNAGLASLFLTAQIDNITIAVNYSFPLPIELLDFKGEQVHNGIELEWEVATEANNDYFTIEKLQSKDNWIAIEKIKGCGNSINTHNHKALDEMPDAENYYRLRQTDFNGQTSVSEIIKVDYKKQEPVYKLTAFPSPVIDKLFVLIPEETDKVQLFSSAGEILLEHNIIDRNNDRLEFDFTNYPSGVYILKSYTDSEITQLKVVK